MRGVGGVSVVTEMPEPSGISDGTRIAVQQPPEATALAPSARERTKNK